MRGDILGQDEESDHYPRPPSEFFRDPPNHPSISIHPSLPKIHLFISHLSSARYVHGVGALPYVPGKHKMTTM